jgi:beta-amylase
VHPCTTCSLPTTHPPAETRISHAGHVIDEITVGCGPAGEARYPSYPEGDGRWRFPGVGEFQCYDRYMLTDLAHWADECNQPLWGMGGPHDAGGYCSCAEDTAFFKKHGGWSSPYGHFFLEWYSQKLTTHVKDMLAIAQRVLSEPGRPRVVRFFSMLPLPVELRGGVACVSAC